MSKRIDLISAFYDGYKEDIRLTKSKHGQLEYLTTMHYIHRALPKDADILEVGAGTGRYSIALAKEGYRVTAVELAEKNFDVLIKNIEEVENIVSYRGDALDLSCFPDNAFDLTLLLGPLYHLYEQKDQLTALKEAVRVTKEGGTVMVAFLSVHAIIYNDYLRGNLIEGIEENFTDNFRVKHYTEQLFTGFNIDEFEALFDDLPVTLIKTVSTDSILEFAENKKDFAMSDEEFEEFAKYHLMNCERRELLGASSHLLTICRKNANSVQV